MSDLFQQTFESDQSLAKAKAHTEAQARTIRATEKPMIVARHGVRPKGFFSPIKLNVRCPQREPGDVVLLWVMDFTQSFLQHFAVYLLLLPPALSAGLRFDDTILYRLYDVATA
jgi:hypothetical protein